MKSTKLLLVESKHAEIPSFASDLQKKGFEVVVTRNGIEAAKRLEKASPHLAVVNAASMRSSGVRICHALREKDSKLPIILVVGPKVVVNKDAADSILTLPFTVQKLANRIRPLLPSDGKNVVHAGPIRLDLEHRRVKCLGRNTKLTPRLIKILKILIEQHGEVVERETLFKRVWETNYTGDTRTLDVHISWLRRAIEMDPEHPRFLKTIRGLGYRLDV